MTHRTTSPTLITLAAACMLTVAMSLPQQAAAADTGIALGARLGLRGVGIDLTGRVLDGYLNVRGGYNWLDVDYDAETDDVEYTIAADLTGYNAWLDYHPFKNHFRISAGAVFNGDGVDATADLADSTSIGGNEYTPEQVGTLSGTITLTSEISPYIGIGFGNPVKRGQRLSFMFDIGVIFQDYEVALGASGPIANVPQFQDDLAQEEADLQEELDKYSIYPVLSIGMSYQF
jgi:hypothetical protein